MGTTEGTAVFRHWGNRPGKALLTASFLGLSVACSTDGSQVQQDKLAKLRTARVIRRWGWESEPQRPGCCLHHEGHEASLGAAHGGLHQGPQSFQRLTVLSARVQSHLGTRMHWSVLGRCNRTPETGRFIKRRGLFSSQFCRLKAQDPVALLIQPLVRGPLASSCHSRWSHGDT